MERRRSVAQRTGRPSRRPELATDSTTSPTTTIRRADDARVLAHPQDEPARKRCVPTAVPTACSGGASRSGRPGRAARAGRRGRARPGVQRLHGEHRGPVRVPAAELGEQPRSPAALSAVADGPDPVIGASDAPCFLGAGSGKDPVEIHFGGSCGPPGRCTPSRPPSRRYAGSQRLDADRRSGDSDRAARRWPPFR